MDMEPETTVKENTEMSIAEADEILKTDSNTTNSSDAAEHTDTAEYISAAEHTGTAEYTSVAEHTGTAEHTSVTDHSVVADNSHVVEHNNVAEMSQEEDSKQPKDNMTDFMERNPRVEKILTLEKEIRRQNEQEKLRSRRIQQEQEYINKMMGSSVEELLIQTKEERKYNEELEQRIRGQVYRMHGLSDDKIEGMQEYHNAWYQGAAFSLFFLSSILFVFCGVLHGFSTEISLFMAFFTAIGGTLLTNLKNQSGILGFLVKALYMLLFPAMMTVFICYELQFSMYEDLLFVLIIAGTVVLLLGVFSYFIYDPYSEDRKRRKKAERYMRKMEKVALKEVQKKEKKFDRQERKRKRQEKREEKKKLS